MASASWLGSCVRSEVVTRFLVDREVTTARCHSDECVHTGRIGSGCAEHLRDVSDPERRRRRELGRRRRNLGAGPGRTNSFLAPGRALPKLAGSAHRDAPRVASGQRVWEV